MRTISFGGLAIVAAAALAAPLALGLFPRIRLPAIVLDEPTSHFNHPVRVDRLTSSQ
jgi:hypothetical protein